MRCRWLVPENEKLDSDARARYDSANTTTPAAWKQLTRPTNTISGASQPSKQSSKKRSKKNLYTDLPQGKRVYFLIDLETTGSKRNWDRGIEYCILAYTEDGKLVDQFYSRVSNDGVRIKPSAYAVHGISYTDLRDAPKFQKVGCSMNSFFAKTLQDYDAGILVAVGKRSVEK